MEVDRRSAFARLRDGLAAAVDDPELPRLCKGLSTVVAFTVDDATVAVRIDDGVTPVAGPGATAEVTMSASAGAWEGLLRIPPLPAHQSFTALCLANPAFRVEGAPHTVAQARAALERLVEILTATPPASAPVVARSLDALSGRYSRIEVGGVPCEVHHESSGTGPDDVPVVFLHTAGADSRQFHGQLSDVALGRACRMTAFDLPFHGRSMPPREWDGSPYRLDLATYRAWCASFLEQVIGRPAVVVGCSMGAAMALVLAADRPDLVRGVVAVEPPFRSKGRANPFQDHAHVHGAHHNAAYVRGLMSPLSPQDDRRRAAWIYSQGAPGVYQGDLAFYSDEFDGASVGPRVDASRTPVALLSGAYDYSATPEDGARLAEAIPGALHVVMDDLGHFPMTEHPDAFRPHLVHALRHASGGLIDVG